VDQTTPARRPGPDQRGARAVGTIRTFGPTRLVDGPLEGSVAGDILQFEHAGNSLRGEATVNGDEMTGRVVGGVTQMSEGRLVLRRVDRAALPPVTRP
jgi:hypothetical protein